MPALSVRNLTMTFIERNLFTDVSFDIENNDKVGFIGANGVGKTTLFKILNGEISPARKGMEQSMMTTSVSYESKKN